MENEQLQELLKELTEVVKDGRGFASDQLPLLAQEIVTHGRVLYSCNMGISVLLLMLGIALACFLPRAFSTEEEKSSAAFIGFLLPFVFSLVVFSFNVSPLLQVWLAPRMYIVDYLGEKLQ